MVTHYNGSRGPVEIGSMPYPHLKNARDKLVREQKDGARQDEIDAMSAQVDALDAVYAAQQAEQADG